jgi:pimeloyl-ACP methyl ester carboxylesterase
VEREVEVRGARLSVTVSGNGPLLVWGHGVTSSRRREDEMGGLFGWSGLAADGRATVVRYDARGHGRSSATADPEDYRWSALAGDEWALVDALGLDRPVLGGASLGAATALHAALQRPADVAGLLLVIPPTAWATRAAQAGLYRAGADLVEASGVGAFLEAAAASPVPDPFAELPEAPRPVPDVAEDVLPAVLRGAARSDLPEPDELRSLDVPALILAWTGDAGHPVVTAEVLADVLPQASLVVASDLASVLAWPERVAELLASAFA